MTNASGKNVSTVGVRLICTQLLARPTHVIDDETREERLEDLQILMDLMRPAVQADGGDLVLLSADPETGEIEVQLQGACSSCAVSSSTLEGGVKCILMERLDWVTDVIGRVEEVDFDLTFPQGVGGWVPKDI